MDLQNLESALADLPLGEIRFLKRVGSTNDFAAGWVREGAPDLSLVIADEQTSGRGRGGKHWFTPPGSALACSLILTPDESEAGASLARYTALGAMALYDALAEMGISAEIKWPNDVLVSGKKISGVLAEGDWIGDELTAIILGIGVNVRPESVPPENELSFPATCVEAEYGENINRTRLLRDILGALLTWRGRIQTPAFVETWAERLAFQGRDVVVSGAGALFQGQIIGLTEAGSLTVRAESGEQQDFQVGEVRLRPS